MNPNFNSINSINIEKTLSIIFIIIGLANIFGDDLLIKSFNCNRPDLKNKAETIFLWGLIAAFLLYIVIVSRNYQFYQEKKDAGLDATPELMRLFGSLLILAGFAIIFYYFINNSFNTDNPPVL